nr:MAG TPA: AAA domain protein [Caudoviricetes sp.]
MGVPVLILGESGSGKSASLRNFAPEEVSIFNVAGKPLPFRKKLPMKSTSDYGEIQSLIHASQKKAFVIDDSQYLLCFEAFAKAKEAGYGKYTDMALHFYNLVQYVIRQTPPDVIIYFLHHTETDSNNGKTKAKTMGKMLDNQLTVEGLFSIVLMCYTDGKKHVFVTQSDGMTTCKSPMDMFPLEIDNDLKLVDKSIRDYYDMNNKKENEK